HPNARVFVTHGGMLGTQESIYHGVPLLGLPFGNDQRANVARAVRDGWGLKLDWDKVNDHVLDGAIRHLINDPSVKANVTKWSQLMHDEIMPGKEVAAYWIEYVIRHGGTKHLQLASKNMPFYQRNLIDVAFFLGVIASLFLLIVFMLTHALLQCYRKRTSEKQKKHEMFYFNKIIFNTMCSSFSLTTHTDGSNSKFLKNQSSQLNTGVFHFGKAHQLVTTIIVSSIRNTMRLQLITLVVLSALATESCMGERIVVLYPAGAKSHFYAVMPLLEELAERGHNLTVFSPYKGITKTIKDATEIFLASIAQKVDTIDIDWFGMQKQGSKQFFTMMRIMTDLSVLACEGTVTNPEFQNVIKNRDVDLFIVDAFGHEFIYPIIHKIGIPFVIHGSSSPLQTTLDAMGAPKEYASVPAMPLDFDNHMNFFQRLVNVVLGEALKLMRNILIIAKLDAIVQREFPGVKTIQEVEGEASLYISNAHAITNWPRSLPPTVLTIGAIHARPAKQLPPKFKVFADEAKDGFIVFTLGSFVSVSSMPQDLVDTFMRVFSKLPQRVIWKWEAAIPDNIPPNIMMVDWLPQQDL
ncbi:Ugt36Ba, partial [Daphnia magna]